METSNLVQFPIGKKKKEEATMTQKKKMTNIEMYENLMCIKNTSETGKLGYALAKNLRRLTDAAEEYLKTRDEKLMEFGEDQGNGQYRIPKEKIGEFREVMKEFDEMEEEFDAYTISEEMFTSGNLTTAQMFTLGWMVNEEE